MTESELQKQCEAFLSKHSIVHLHIHNNASQQRNRANIFKKYKGFPDLAIFLPHGFTVFVELKIPGGKLSVDQEYYITMLKNAGYDVQVIDDYYLFETYIRDQMSKLGYQMRG